MYYSQQQAVFKACEEHGPLMPKALKPYVDGIYGRAVSKVTICKWKNIWAQKNVRNLRKENQAVKQYDDLLGKLAALKGFKAGALQTMTNLLLKFNSCEEFTTLVRWHLETNDISSMELDAA